jgi:hypothetical protein
VFPIEPPRVVHGQSPEQRLMAAVLTQAMDDLRLIRGYRGRSRLAQVERWFDARRQEWPFSFENLCAGLGLDADRIRAVVLPRLRTQ